MLDLGLKDNATEDLGEIETAAYDLEREASGKHQG